MRKRYLWHCLLLILVFFVSTNGSGLNYNSDTDRYNPRDYSVHPYGLTAADSRHHADFIYQIPGLHHNSEKYPIYISGINGVAIISDGYKDRFLRDDLAFVLNVYMKGEGTNIWSKDTDELVLCAYYLQSGSNPWKNVIVVADGFDPLQGRTYRELVLDEKYNAIFDRSKQSPLAFGYDIVFVDFKYGGGDIRFNAKAYLALLEVICGYVKKNDGNVISAGFSMGGLVARLALLYSEKGGRCDYINNVVKYIAIDSPQQGAAAVMIDLQRFLRDFQDLSKVNRGWKMVNNDAARQMLYENVTSQKDENGKRTVEHGKFFNFIEDMGNYNSRVPRYALADCNLEGPTPYLPPGSKIMDFTFGLDQPFNGLAEYKYNIVVTEHEVAPGAFRPTLEELLEMESTSNWLHFFSGVLSGGIIAVNARFRSSPNPGMAYLTTHMPLYSVFDVEKNVWEEELSKMTVSAGTYNTDRMAVKHFFDNLQANSPFSGIYWMEKRREHITFDENLNIKLLEILGETRPVSIVAEAFRYH